MLILNHWEHQNPEEDLQPLKITGAEEVGMVVAETVATIFQHLPDQVR